VVHPVALADWTDNAPAQQLQTLSLRGVVHVTGHVNILAGRAHRQHNIGYDLGVAAGAND
jgi:hypothetical protein